MSQSSLFPSVLLFPSPLEDGYQSSSSLHAACYVPSLCLCSEEPHVRGGHVIDSHRQNKPLLDCMEKSTGNRPKLVRILWKGWGWTRHSRESQGTEERQIGEAGARHKDNEKRGGVDSTHPCLTLVQAQIWSLEKLFCISLHNECMRVNQVCVLSSPPCGLFQVFCSRNEGPVLLHIPRKTHWQTAWMCTKWGILGRHGSLPESFSDSVFTLLGYLQRRIMVSHQLGTHQVG